MDNSFEIVESKQHKRLAFDMGASGALSRENVASYVNEAGVCISKEDAISVFTWEKRDGGVFCGEIKESKDVSEYMSWEGEISRQESEGAMAMREQFLAGSRLCLQIMGPIKGIYNEGRGVLMRSNGEVATLYGFRIEGDLFDGARGLSGLQKMVNNPMEINEQTLDAMRSVSFEMKVDKTLADLQNELVELAGIWQRIEDGRAEEKFERLKEKVGLVTEKYERLLDKQEAREPELIRVGAMMERDLGSMGLGVAMISGCGYSNRALEGNGGMGGWGLVNLMDRRGVLEWQSWQKPDKKRIYKDGKWVDVVKIEKCGFHWKNGGSCVWEPNDYIEVGSKCPRCGNKFICA